MARIEAESNKETRISIRVDYARKAVIARAAKSKHITLTNFILENAYQAASKIIADENPVMMTKEQFKYMCKMLDKPPAKNINKMSKLLRTKTPFDA